MLWSIIVEESDFYDIFILISVSHMYVSKQISEE